MLSASEWSILRFSPLYQERVWGGRRLASLYNRELPKQDVPYGESWEVCDRPEAQSEVINGALKGKTLNELWTQGRAEVFGTRFVSESAERFPLLLKILDASDDLSIQVHPNDETCGLVNGEAKSEAWYVAHAEPGSRLYAGLQAGAGRESFAAAMENGTVAEQVLAHDACRGACVAIHGGVMHAIGAGLVIFEIQQNSDTTYRVFDWNRVGLDGKPRELHQEQALQVTDFNAPPVGWQQLDGTKLLDWKYFKLDVCPYQTGEQGTAPGGQDFAMGAIVSGGITFGDETLCAGDFFLVPAAAQGEARQFKSHETSEVLWITL